MVEFAPTNRRIFNDEASSNEHHRLSGLNVEREKATLRACADYRRAQTRDVKYIQSMDRQGGRRSKTAIATSKVDENRSHAFCTRPTYCPFAAAAMARSRQARLRYCSPPLPLPPPPLLRRSPFPHIEPRRRRARSALVARSARYRRRQSMRPTLRAAAARLSSVS